MRLYVALLILVSIAAPAAAAIEKADIVFSIQRDFSVEETISFVSDRPFNETIDYRLDEEVSSIRASDSSGDLRHEFIKNNPGYVLKIYPHNDTRLNISFVSRQLVFQNNDVYQFFAELNLNAKTMGVRVVLPEGFGIYQNSYRPASGVAGTDGRNIAVLWSFSDFSEPAVFSVKFEQLGKELNIWIIAVILLVAALGYGYKYHRKKSEEATHKARQEFFTGFREDEKKVIEYLEKHQTAWQNKIEQEFKFSRAKMTRIVQKLAEKKLLAKKRKGRTNRLTWLKEN